MSQNENSHFKIIIDDVPADQTLQESRGWHKMDVRWLVTGQNADSKNTVVGRTIMPPKVNSKHAIHRHPNAEEWEYIVSGVATKHVGGETFTLRAGELAYIPRNVWHGLENASDTEPLVTLWGYCGASSLEEAGYVIPADDEKNAATPN
jgi:quercetin dioxygenase-like cupin family protein